MVAFSYSFYKPCRNIAEMYILNNIFAFSLKRILYKKCIRKTPTCIKKNCLKSCFKLYIRKIIMKI